MQTNICRTSHGSVHMLDDNIQMQKGENKLSFLTNLQAGKASHFGLLMENLDMLEATFNDSGLGRLERDILVQLERLGALRLFHIYLSRTLKSSTIFDLCDTPTELIREPQMNGTVDVHIGKVIVRSGKREERKSRRERASEKAYVSSPSKSIQQGFQHSNFSSIKRSSTSRSRRIIIAKNEAEMSRGVKVMS